MIVSIKMNMPLLILMVLLSHLGYPQPGSDSIVGKWLKTPKEDLIIEVYKSKDSYTGKISWVKDNARKKPIGFKIVEGLQYDPKKKVWEKGKISDPRSGKTYGARAKIKADGTLELRAYKGLTILGRKKDFIRLK